MKFDPFHQIFAPPTFKDDYGIVIAKFLNAILVTLISVISLLLVYRLLTGGSLIDSPEQILSVIILINIVLLIFARRGYVFQTSIVLVFAMWAAMTYQAWIADGVYDLAVVTYIIIILMTSVLTNWRLTMLVTIMSILSVWGMSIFHVNVPPDFHVDEPMGIARDLTVVYILAFLLIYYLVSTLRASMEKSSMEFKERILTEQSMREQGERFRRIFHVSPVAISITTLKDGKLVEANNAYWKLTGLDPRTSIGRTMVDLGIWANEAERQKFVEKLTERKSLHNSAYEFLNRNGERRVTIAFYELIELGAEPTILSMFHDATEQQAIQTALQESEKKYRNFVEQSIEGIWLLAFDRPIQTSLPPEEQTMLIYKHAYIAECNDALARMYGYNSSEEIRGARLLDFEKGGEIDKVNFQATLKLVKDGYRSGSRETREVTRNGETVYFLNNAVGIVKDGLLEGVWGTQLDITALKKAEEALRRSESRARALLDAIPDMIFELKRDGTIIHFIPSAMSEPLIPPEKFIGKTIAQVLPSLADQTAFAIDRALASGQLSAFEYKLTRGGEVRTYEARITPAGPDLVLAMVRDVSLTKWAESEREKLIDELEAKNAELERFTYTVSHDLKSPLITIRGFLGFIREDAERGNLQRLNTDIQRISDATDKMQRLLNELLELSRVGRLTNKPAYIPMNVLLSDVLELLQGRIALGKIKVRIEEGLPTVYGDRQRISEVFQNLIDNAAKFMGEQPEPCIEIGVQGEMDGRPIFFVRDNGIGIAPEYKDRIFGLFDKLDSQTEGTGIGLALVKRIIEFHGGRIWVESELGKGATFLFTLPTQPIPER